MKYILLVAAIAVTFIGEAFGGAPGMGPLYAHAKSKMRRGRPPPPPSYFHGMKTQSPFQRLMASASDSAAYGHALQHPSLGTSYSFYKGQGGLGNFGQFGGHHLGPLPLVESPLPLLKNPDAPLPPLPIDQNLIQDIGAGDQISKSVYVFSAPPDPADGIRPQLLKTFPQERQKHYQVVFINAPNPPLPAQHTVQLPPPPELKTQIYVLVKKPHAPPPVKVLPSKVPVNKPEVFFIRYKNKDGSIGEIPNGIGGIPPIPPPGEEEEHPEGEHQPHPPGPVAEELISPLTPSVDYDEPVEPLLQFRGRPVGFGEEFRGILPQHHPAYLNPYGAFYPPSHYDGAAAAVSHHNRRSWSRDAAAAAAGNKASVDDKWKAITKQSISRI